MNQLKDRNIVQLLRTSGSTLQLNGDVLTDENGVSLKCEHITIKEGELIIAMDNEKPKIYFLKNNGEFAEFIDKKEIITNEFVESRALIDLHNMIAVLKQIVGDGFYDGTLTDKINKLIQYIESLGGGAVTDYVNFLKDWIICDLGTYENIDLFLEDLNSMANKSQKSGKYFATVNDIKCNITFISLDKDSDSFCQTIEGPIRMQSNNIDINNNNKIRIASRVYNNNTWSDWTTLVYNNEISVCQTDANGNSKNYIYSKSGDTSHEVLSGTFRTFQENGNLKLQHKLWGSQNNYNDVHKHTVVFPVVNDSSNGVMNHNVYKRLLNNTISEQNSTNDTVNVSYTNFNGDSNILKLTKATTAKAGVMTTDQYNKLNELSAWLRGTLGNFNSTDALKTALANMPTTHNGEYGRYFATISGVTVYITFISLEESTNTFSQWVEGPLIKNSIDGDIYLNNELGAHIIGRVYSNGMWGLWRSNVLDDEVNNIPIASSTNNGLMSKENAKSLTDIQTSYKDLGNFNNENEALSNITDLSVCADSNIVHAHMTYANGNSKTSLILIQSIDGNMCRQIIYNKMKVFHRTITFTDENRTAIQTKEDWMFLFGDRLVWSTSGNKYVLSQFGNGYGHSYCSPIPTVTNENDGLMSKEDKSTLEEFNTYGYIGTLSSWNNIAKLTTESTEEDILKTLTITTLNKEVTSTKEELFAILDKCAINKKILKESSTNAFVFVEYIGNCYILQIVGNKAALLNNNIVGTPVIRGITISGLSNETLKVRKTPFEIKLETINTLNTKVVSLEAQIKELTERITALERV